MLLRIAIAALVIATACGSDEPPEREIEDSLSLDDNGISTVLDFEIPANTRSLTIVVTGSTDELYALASLEVDGTELVGIDTAQYQGDEMEAMYYQEQAGQMPGNLFQSIRLGTFSHVYPYAPGALPSAGPARLRVASTARTGSVDVRILMPEEDGASTLRLNLVATGDAAPESLPETVIGEWQRIFDQAGIDLAVDDYVVDRDNALGSISDFTEPQESPTSESAQLAVAGSALVDSDALNVFLVDGLPFGVAGLSLGVPGPPVPDSYYFGVIIRYDSDSDQLARVIAHEVGHFLALQHPENRGVSGTVYPDPIDDTEPGTGNLMDQGTELSAGQSFALRRSALLE